MNWQTFEKEIDILAEKIHEHFDIIVAVVRGGIIPARLLATRLNISEIHCLSVKKIDAERKVVTQIAEDLKNKKILLIEDILESGRSLMAGKSYLESKGAIVKTACLYIIPTSEIQPDYFLRKVESIQEFPWE